MSAPPDNSPQTTTITWEPQYATPVHANLSKFRTAHSLAAASTGYVDVSSSQWSPSSSVGPRRMVPNIIARCPPSSSMLIPPPGTAIPTPLAVRSFNHPMRNSVYADQMAPARKKSPLAPPDAKVATYTGTGMVFSPDIDQPCPLSPPLIPGALSPSVVLQHGLQAWVSPQQGSIDFSDTLTRVREMGGITALRSPGETSLEITQANSPYHSAGASFPIRPNLRYNASNFLTENPDIHILPLNKRRILYCHVKQIVLTMLGNADNAPNFPKIRVEHGGYSCLWDPTVHCELTIPLDVTANLHWTPLAGDLQAAPQCVDVPCMLINNMGISSYSFKPPRGDAKISLSISFTPATPNLCTEFDLPGTSTFAQDPVSSHNQSPSTPAPVASQNLATKIVQYRTVSGASGDEESSKHSGTGLTSTPVHDALISDLSGCAAGLMFTKGDVKDDPQNTNAEVIEIALPSMVEEITVSQLVDTEKLQANQNTTLLEDKKVNMTCGVVQSQQVTTKQTSKTVEAEVSSGELTGSQESEEISGKKTDSQPQASEIALSPESSDQSHAREDAEASVQITILTSEDTPSVHVSETIESISATVGHLEASAAEPSIAPGNAIGESEVVRIESTDHAEDLVAKSMGVDGKVSVCVDVPSEGSFSNDRGKNTKDTCDELEGAKVLKCSDGTHRSESHLDVAPDTFFVNIAENFGDGNITGEVCEKKRRPECATIAFDSQGQEDLKESKCSNPIENLCIETECEISSMEPLSSIAEDVIGGHDPRQPEKLEAGKGDCSVQHLGQITPEITPSEDVSLKSIDPLASSDEDEEGQENSTRFIPRQDFANVEVQWGTPSGDSTVVKGEGKEGTEDKIIGSTPAESESSSVVLTDDESLSGSVVKDAPEFAPEEDEEDAEELKKILFRKRSSKIIQVTRLGIPEETIENVIVLQEGIAQAPVKKQLKAVQEEVLQVPAKKQMKAVVEEVLKVPALKQYKAVQEEVLRVPIKRHYKAVHEEVLKVPTRKNFKAVQAEIQKIPAKKTMKEVMKELTRKCSSPLSEEGLKSQPTSADSRISKLTDARTSPIEHNDGTSSPTEQNDGTSPPGQNDGTSPTENNEDHHVVKGKKRTGSALDDISRAKKSKDATSNSASRRADARTRARGKQEKDRAVEVNLLDRDNSRMSHDEVSVEKRAKSLSETRQIRTEISSFKHTERTCMRKRTNASEHLPVNTPSSNGSSSPGKRQFGLAKTQLSLVNEIVEKGKCSPRTRLESASAEQTPAKTLTFDDTVKLYEFTSPDYLQRAKNHPQ